MHIRCLNNTSFISVRIKVMTLVWLFPSESVRRRNWFLAWIHPILVNGNQLEVVRSAKLLGMIITSDLSWNEHINETVKKASKRLYFLVQLKRAKLPRRDLVLFYATCIRSILVYASPVFFLCSAQVVQCELERVQKKVIINHLPQSVLWRGT